jgi:hypothetical protein
MTFTPERPRGLDPTHPLASQIAELRDGLTQALVAMADEQSDLELTHIVRRFVAQARNAGISLETAVAVFRDVFAARFQLANRIISRLRCERLVTYLIAAYRWEG